MFPKNIVKSLLMASLLISGVAISPEIKASECQSSDDLLGVMVVAAAATATATATYVSCWATIRAILSTIQSDTQNELMKEFNDGKISFHDLKVKTRKNFFYFKYLNLLFPWACDFNYPVQVMKNTAWWNAIFISIMSLLHSRYSTLNKEMWENIAKMDENKECVEDERKYNKERRSIVVTQINNFNFLPKF